jgi:WhiB family redox-sensing transcriptional regulator
MMEAVTEPVVDKSWQDFANCLGVDPDLFFRNAAPRHVKPEVCRGASCRTASSALANGESSASGGMSERERRIAASGPARAAPAKTASA